MRTHVPLPLLPLLPLPPPPPPRWGAAGPWGASSTWASPHWSSHIRTTSIMATMAATITTNQCGGAISGRSLSTSCSQRRPVPAMLVVLQVKPALGQRRCRRAPLRQNSRRREADINIYKREMERGRASVASSKHGRQNRTTEHRCNTQTRNMELFCSIGWRNGTAGMDRQDAHEMHDEIMDEMSPKPTADNRRHHGRCTRRAQTRLFAL